MLKLILMPLFLWASLLTNINYWHTSCLLLFITATMSLTSIYSPYLSTMLITPNLLMDPMTCTLLSLTIWTTPLMLIASQKIKVTMNNSPKFFTLVLLLTLILTLTFTTTNLLSFYVLFEASLIPTLLIILGWGYQPERLQAGIYLMMYTITASLPLLMGLTLIYHFDSHLAMNLTLTKTPHYTPHIELWWLLCTLAFLAKMPMFLFHLWLPKAHVEAPVAGSMILAAILLKLGGYGLLRMSYMMGFAEYNLFPLISSISLWGAVITGMICMRQTDMKSLIAYSSVGHMGLLLAGLTTNSEWGWTGALTMMLAHGLCSSGLFALANMNYETTNTRNLYLYKGTLSLFPLCTLLWFIMSAANMAAPPSINLLSEVLLISATAASSSHLMPLLALTAFISAAYTLFMYTSVNHGNPGTHAPQSFFNLHRHTYIITMHALPIFLLISSPEIITLWT